MTEATEAPRNGLEPRSSEELIYQIDEEFDALTVEYKKKPILKYPAKLHVHQVVKYLGVTEGLIYLPGQRSAAWEDSDQEKPFRQLRYFYYITGVDFPDSIVTYNIKSDELSLWILPPNSGSSVIFNGQVPTVDEVKVKYDFDQVSELPNLDSYLTWYAHNEPGKIYLLHDYQAPKNIAPQRLANKDGHWTWLSVSPFDSTSLINAMNASRSIKSPHELSLIRRAISITSQAHINVLKGLHSFTHEAEIEAIFAATCISNLAKKQSYGIIAGSGSNASTLHYVANNEPLKGRQLVCLDAGVEWECYASDVTRTFPISGYYTKEAREIYEIVERMQEECIEMCTPGTNFVDVYMHAHKVAVEGLIELGILHNGTFDEIYASGVSVAFFPHGLGHSVGLEVHDVVDTGSMLFKRGGSAFLEILTNTTTTRPSVILYPNMVYTVEPGIYFNSYALETLFLPSPKHSKYINTSLLSTYYPVGGVRIEDDILITEDGYENLTIGIPKGDDALRIIRNGWGDSWERVERVDSRRETVMSEPTRVGEDKITFKGKGTGSLGKRGKKEKGKKWWKLGD